MKRKLLYAGIFLLLLASWFLYQLFGPHTKVQLGRSTTYITEPLAEDGLPNYLLAINRRLSEGVTPENNGGLPFCRAIGPAEGMKLSDFALICDEIRLEQVDLQAFLAPPYDDKALIEALGVWLSQDKQSKHWSHDFDGGSTFDTTLAGEELLDQAMMHHWTKEQIPRLALWVEQNNQPLNWLVEASEKEKFFVPSITTLTNPNEEVINMLLPHVQAARGAARALAIRAQRNLGQGDLKQCWRDLRAIMKLGEHIANGTTIVEKLVATATQGFAMNSLQSLLNHGDLQPELARQILSDLNALNTRVDMASAIECGERFTLLDTTLRFATGRLGGTQGLNGYNEMGMKAAVDANLMLEMGNAWHDRLSEAARLGIRLERRAALAIIDHELAALGDTVRLKFFGALFSRNQRSQVLASIIHGLMLPAITAAIDAEDRGQLQLELARVATALAVHRAEQGEYPETLDSLVPGILDAVPQDLFSGKPLIYRRMDAGYLLYSVGENEKDDNGTQLFHVSDDEPWRIINGQWVDAAKGEELQGDHWEQNQADLEGDDLVIRLPLPKHAWPAPATNDADKR